VRAAYCGLPSLAYFFYFSCIFLGAMQLIFTKILFLFPFQY